MFRQRLRKLSGATKVVFAALSSPTIEHVNVMARQLMRAGTETAALTFGDSSFSFGRVSPTRGIELIECSNLNSLRDGLTARKDPVVLFQSPYPEHYPSWLIDATPALRTAYAGYGIPLSGWYEGHFKTAIIASTNFLLAGSKYESDGYRREVASASTLFVGNPLLFEIRRAMAEAPLAPDDETPRLLWAPHWTRAQPSETTFGFSTWSESVFELLAWAESTGLPLTVRPHPILRIALEHRFQGSATIHREALKTIGREDGEAIAAFETLLQLTNVSLSNDGMLEDILSHDGLVTDGVSIIGYWCTTGKPIVVTRKESTPAFNSHGEALVETCDVAVGRPALRSWLNRWGDTLRFSPTSKLRAYRSQQVHPTFRSSPMEHLLRAL